ncbi:cytochrome P450 3A31-like [Ptychodera flava]|uniref:cytochrome P450 3A31-like n=1 Tax=Ptychodera flava TaxID=63121 RepID=UPI003969DBCE
MVGLMSSINVSSYLPLDWVLTILAVFIIWWSIRPYTFLNDCNLPGPRPWPLVGSFFLLYGGGRNYHENVLKMTQKYGKVFCWYEGRTPTITITDPKLLKEILVREFSKFQDRNHPMGSPKRPSVTTSTLLRLNGKRWKDVRTIVSPAFSSGKIKEMSNLVNDITGRLMGVLEGYTVKGEPIEVFRVFGNYTLDVIATCAFGIETDCQGQLGSQFGDNARRLMLKSMNKNKAAFVFLAVCPSVVVLMRNWVTNTKPFRFFYRVLEDTLALRKDPGTERQDFLQMLLKAAENGDEKGEKSHITDSKTKLTEVEIMAQILVFLLAGYETTGVTLTFCAYELATHPEVQDKLIEEIDERLKGETQLDLNAVQTLPYMEMVISETMRLYTPAPRFNRKCLQSCTINGINFRKGVVVDVPIYTIHHNPEYWPEPEKFKPERFTAEAKAERDPYTFLPFSHGPRSCIGMRFAQMEMKITLARILQKYRFKTCADTEIPLSLRPGVVTTPMNGVMLTVVRRENSA